ncbi:hypothetical protein PTKIN_Ptkin11bG0140000 [Pterospermum kingtungense]
MYCQLLAGLIQRDQVVTIGSVFASTVLKAIKFLEGNWKELCSNIKTGQLSDWITDKECRTAVSLIMKPDPELANLIETYVVVNHGKEQSERYGLKQNTEPVDLVNVKPGQYYELLVTTSRVMVIGFQNNTPHFKFVERQNVILSIDTDKTSESDLLKAVTEPKTLLHPLGFTLTEYTSCGDTSSTPGVSLSQYKKPSCFKSKES